MTTQIIDTLLLCLVATVGIVGSICVFSSDLDSPESAATWSRIKDIKPKQHTYNKTSRSTEDILSILHTPESPEFQFEIKNYNSRAQYYFDTGDGASVLVAKSPFIHTYKKAGKYQVKLEMEYRGQKKLVACKNITTL